MTTAYITSLMSFTLALHNIRGDFDCFYAFMRPRKRTIDSHSVSWTSLMLAIMMTLLLAALQSSEMDQMF